MVFRSGRGASGAHIPSGSATSEQQSLERKGLPHLLRSTDAHIRELFGSASEIRADVGVRAPILPLLQQALALAGGAKETWAGKPRELAAGTAAIRSAGLRPASSGGFQPPVLVV